jgi:hypothetical protein
VRLLEIAYGDVDHVDHMGDAVEELTWTNQADRKAMPRIDGALALYDVRTRASVEQVKEMLGEYALDSDDKSYCLLCDVSWRFKERTKNIPN